MIRINDILDKVTSYNPEADLDIIERAYIYTARVHEGQVRLSGEPYLSHPLEVAGILADMKLDAVSVAAGLLHDVIEDTHATAQEIMEIFGEDSQARQAENIRKMILAMADDIRVIMIKLADRLHNMVTLNFHSDHKRLKIAQETLDIYAPIAARLGIYWIKKELEDTSFMYLQPEEYAKIKEFVNTNREEREKYIETVKSFIEKKMDEANLKCEVRGRFKYYYSIYQKMLKQGLAFEEVYDIIAFRIIL
ncbi:MAG: bifunctional (p)ppGpp synthetase/guanosine-3',5'-bis(diphosphate) 3'-pyrophosphohydrolase, partial [Deltaproteobacteria bacterium]|nr:bifunctional (p)ppGpp synthetase/guanosine-3',5'-bis(diphosphate) 3'-pyrophosphohydrolase [Deltaproteobacteria bacterium]